METSPQLHWQGMPVLMRVPLSQREFDEALADASHVAVAIAVPPEHDEWLESAVMAGAVALLQAPLKDKEIEAAAAQLAAGAIYVSPELAAPLVCAWRRSAYRDRMWQRLTEREREIMQLLAQGKSNRQIASLLFLSPHTVRNHLSRIFAKLDVAGREQACALWRTANLEPRAHAATSSD